MARVLVTGAASGIGAATATLLEEDGWEVVRADLKPDEGMLELDTADETGWDRALDAAGGVDALVNCAGHRDRAPLVELTVESFDRMLAVHVRGTFLGIRGCARRWLADGRRGSVVAISSVNATHAVPGQPHYAAAKAGVSGLVRAAAVELAPAGIRVNAIAPGVIETPMTAERLGDPAMRREVLARVPTGEHGRPADVAAAVGYPLSDGARYVTGTVLAMALARAELLGDELLLVTGAGPIGLAITVSAAARGHAVLVTDPVPTRRALAVELGAAHTVDPTAPDAADEIRERTADVGPDVAFEASGTAPGLAASLAALGNGGRLVVVGVAAHDLVVPVPRILFEGLTVVGARAGLFTEALRVVTAQRTSVARFAGRSFPLDEVATAFTYAIENARDVVKVLVEP